MSERFKDHSPYATREKGRNGSPFQADKVWRRPSPMAGRILRAVRDLLALLAFLTLVWIALSSIGQRPVLIGQGCEGASGPLYATEESDFPICESIEVNHG